MNRNRTGLMMGLLVSMLLLLGILWPASTFAQQATTPNTEIILDISYDGTAPFVADPTYAGNTDGQHTPGADENGNNYVVRTHDLVQYHIDWNVNEVDATNVVIKVDLPANMEIEWVTDPSLPLPPGCKDSGVTPVSSISADGKSLVCNLGDHREGSAGAIFPTMKVNDHFDNDTFTIDATIETDQSTPVTSNDVTVTISAAPSWDWKKDILPDVYHDVEYNGVQGLVVVWPIYLAPGGADGRGIEPMNDATAIQLFDHFYAWTADVSAPFNATLVTAANVGNLTNYTSGRVCGGYAGTGELPYGVTIPGTSDATNTTQGVQNGTESITCADLPAATTAANYPVVQIDITGHNSQSAPAKRADGGNNSGIVVAAEVPFFIDYTEISVTGTAFGYAHNAITGDTTPIAAPPAIDTVSTVAGGSEIQIAGNSGNIAETTTTDNLMLTQLYATPDGGGGSSTTELYHFVDFNPGPAQFKAIPDPSTGLTPIALDNRETGVGGMGIQGLGPVPDDDNFSYDFMGEVARGQDFTLRYNMTSFDYATGTPISEEIHGCLYIDNTYVEVTEMPTSMDVMEVSYQKEDAVTLGGYTIAPSHPQAHVVYGDSSFNPTRRRAFIRENPAFQPNYVVEFAKAAVPVGTSYNRHDVVCRQADAADIVGSDGIGDWIDINDPNFDNIFNKSADGRFQGVEMVRLRTLEPVTWFNYLEWSVPKVGTRMGPAFAIHLNLRVKSTIPDPIDGTQKIYTHGSRATGDWDGIGDPPTPNCHDNDDIFDSGAPSQTELNPPNGFCNLATVPVQPGGPDPLENGNQGSHRDTLTVVSSRPVIQKSNVAGPADLVDNGDTVTFQIDVGVVGAKITSDAVANIVVSDTLPANFDFVSFVGTPSTVQNLETSATPGATLATPLCSYDGATRRVECSFGDQVGDWEDTITFTVRVKEGVANQVLENTAQVLSDNRDPVSSKAYTYMIPEKRGLAIHKNVAPHNGPCINPPGSTQLAPEDCSLIDIDGQMTFTLEYENTGNVPVTNLAIIDMLPHLGDSTEAQTSFIGTPASTGDLGDGRTPPSAFNGGTTLLSVVDSSGGTISYTSDTAATINRDPAANTNGWSGTLTPATTGISVTVPTLAPGSSGVITLTIDTNGNEIDDIYTNNFGARTMPNSPPNLKLPVRSNDVSIMPHHCTSQLVNNVMTVSGGSIAGQSIPTASDSALVSIHNCGTDYGDLPDGNAINSPDYTTLITSTVGGGNVGPSHSIVDGIYLGSLVDGEDDGQPSAMATGDNTITGTLGIGIDVGIADDEDGITLPSAAVNGSLMDSTFIAGESAIIRASVVNTTGNDVTLYAFIDWDGDGAFSSPGETISSTVASNAATQNILLTVNVPANADTTQMLGARFRLSGDDDLTANGPASDGEVEDYLIQVIELVSLGSTVWLDSDDSGTQDAGEPGIGGVDVQLFGPGPDGVIGGGDDVLVAETTTDANGDYLFDNLAEGDYYVVVPNAPVQAPVSSTGAATDETTDSDDNGDQPGGAGTPTTSQLVTLEAGTEPQNESGSGGNQDAAADDSGNMTIDFGFVPVAALGNYVWLDEDNDGVQDAGEHGIPNVVVELTPPAGFDLGNGPGVAITTTTDANGGYLFDNLPPADGYVVTIDETQDGLAGQGLEYTVPNSTGAANAADLGNQDPAGYTIDLSPGEVDLSGDFGFNYNDNTEVNTNTGVAAIGDTVWIDSGSNGTGDGIEDPSETPVEGVEVTLYGDPDGDGIFNTVVATMTTDAAGHYLFDNLPAGAYAVGVTDSSSASHDILGADYTQTGDPDHFGTTGSNNDNFGEPVVLAPGDVFLNMDFGYQPQPTAALNSVGDTVYFDADADGSGPALPPVDGGITVTQGLPGTADADDYGIESVTVSLIDDVNGNGVWDAGEPVIASDVTDENGQYLFQDLADGNYLVWVNDTDGVLAGLSQTYDSDGTGTADISAVDLDSAGALATSVDDRDQDFGYTPLGNDGTLGMLGDYVWLDLNSDGVQDPNEQGIGGVAVELEFPNGSVITTTTDAQGLYLFPNLPISAGGETYTVTVDSTTLPPGVSQTFDNDAANGDPVALDNQSVTTLTTADPVDLDQDFGYVGENSLGNLLWLDTNTDGHWDGAAGPDGILGNDDDEPLIGGVTIDVYKDTNGNGVLDSDDTLIAVETTAAVAMTTSGDDGNYLVEGLPDGEYFVTVSDNDGVVNGYWHSIGDPNTTDESQNDAYYTVDLDSAEASPAGVEDLTADFGYYVEPASVGNYVWVDTNADGLQNDGETGINGVEVEMVIDYPDGTSVTLVTTTANDMNGNPGWYSFDNLLYDEDYAQGSSTGIATANEPVYTISVDTAQTALDAYTPTQVDVNSNGNDSMDSDDHSGVIAIPYQGLTDVEAQDPATDEQSIASYDFGFVPMDFGDLPTNYNTDIGNTNAIMPAHHAIVSGVHLGASVDGESDGQPSTDADGDDLNGDDENGVTFVSNPLGTAILLAGQPFTLTVEASIAGVLNAWFDWNNDGDLTDADENPFADLALTAGTNTLVLTVPAGVTADDIYSRFRFSSDDPAGAMGPDGFWPNGEVEDYVTPAIERFSLGNRVWDDLDNDGLWDANEDGVANGVVNLLDGAGNPVLDSSNNPITTITDADGYYLFDELPTGDYIVEIDAANFGAGQPLEGFLSSTGAGQEAVPNSDGESNDNGLDAPISGAIRSALVTLSSANGGEPASTSGEIDLGPDGHGTATDAYSNLTVDFGFFKPVTVGDTVWYDNDVDGIQDVGESGVPTVTVTLYNADGTPVTVDADGNAVTPIQTDSNGEYLFENLPPGDYYVQFDLTTLPTGYLPTLDNVASASDSEDSDADPTTGQTPATGFIPSGSENLTLDMGIIYPVSVGDTVWYDDNRNGLQDGGEDGVLGVTVTLYNAGGTLVTVDSAGNPVTPQVTDGNGNYLFAGLHPDDYYVVFDLNTLPTGYQVTQQDAGSDDELDSDADPTTGQTAPTGPLNATTSLADMSLDMGIFGQVAVGDYVWEDLNGDGLQEPNEPGIEGVTATLYDTTTGQPVTNASGNPLTDVTDPTGAYTFRNLPPGDYYVVFSNLPAGYAVTDDDVNGNVFDANDSDVDPTSLATDPTGFIETNDSNMTLDMGLVPLVTVGDYVWNDLNGDGIQDATEPGIANVTAAIYDTATGQPVLVDLFGNPVVPVQTGPSGDYLFENLHPGDYYVLFSNLPSGYVVTEQDAGSDDAIDSDVNPTTLATSPTGFLSGNEEDLTLDMGLVQPVSVGDVVWIDSDSDGIQDAIETGVENVTVTIYSADGTPITTDLFGNPVAPLTTNADGEYRFENLPPGDYYVQFDLTTLPAGYVVTAPNEGSSDALDSDASVSDGTTASTGFIPGGSQNLTLDMGIIQLTDVRVGDYVWNDLNSDGIQGAGEPGIEGVTATLYNADGTPFTDASGNPLMTTTDSSGFYLFDELPQGDYYVAFSNLPSGYVVTEQNAGSDDAADSDVDPTSLQTDTTGLLENGEQNLTLDMGLYQPASIGDTVWLDTDADGVQEAGELGIEGVTVKLYDGNGTLVDTTATDANGNYGFSNLAPGDYYIEVVPPADHGISTQDAGGNSVESDTVDSDIDPTTLQSVVTTLTSGENDPSWDAGLYQNAAIGDYVWLDSDGNGIQDAGEEPITGITVHLYDTSGNTIATTTTDSSGRYGFSGLVPGDYSVGFVAPEGLIQTKANQGGDTMLDSDADPETGRTPVTTLNPLEHDTTWDAGFTPPASVGNYVWFDTNKDGIKEDNEAGVENVRVVLLDESGQAVAETVTDSSGFFQFMDLLPGNYQLQFIPPENFSFTRPGVDRSGLFNSDADPLTGITSAITLDPGENDPEWGAGLVASPTSLDEIDEPGAPGNLIPEIYLPLIE